MKLSVLSITTTILASVVAANPILAPRASSPPFRLQGDFGFERSDRLLAILPVVEPNHPGYFQFGWFGKGSQKIELFLPEGEYRPGRVLDVQQNGYEMVLQSDGNQPPAYRVLLVDQANTALIGLQVPSQFFSDGRQLTYKHEGSARPMDTNGFRWTTCVRSTTSDPNNSEFVEELYFSFTFPEDCELGATLLTLHIDQLSSTAVRVIAAVNV